MRGPFDWLYKNKVWGTGKKGNPLSGAGSTIKATVDLCNVLHVAALLLEKERGSLHVLSIVDAPCGDFAWMRACVRGLSEAFPNTEVRYRGLDISGVVIGINNQEFFGSKEVPEDTSFVFPQHPRVTVRPFRVVDLSHEPGLLRQFVADIDADIILCNDAWQHNTMVNAVKLARILGTSGARLLVSDSKGKNHQTQVNTAQNFKKKGRTEAKESDYDAVLGVGQNINTGGYASYDMTAWPFSLHPLCGVVPAAEANSYDTLEQESIGLFQLPQSPAEEFESAPPMNEAPRCFCKGRLGYTVEQGMALILEQGVGDAGAI